MQTTAELAAGRELDALIAEKVFGWIRQTTELNKQQLVTVPPDWTDFSTIRWWGHDINELVPDYSTDIAAAWQILEKLGGHLEIIHWGDSDTWQVNIGGLNGRKRYTMPQPDWAETVPLAICRAALAAVDR